MLSWSLIERKTMPSLAFIGLILWAACLNVTAQDKFEARTLSKKYDVSVDVYGCENGLCSGKVVFSIFKKRAKKPFQQIHLKETFIRLNDNGQPDFVSVSEKTSGKWSALYLDDFNFDGLEDLALPDGDNGGYRGTSYRIYLYDRSKDRFVYSNSFTRLAQGPYIGIPKIDTKNKTLEVIWKSGAGFHSIERYSVFGKHPRKIYEYSEDSMLNDGNRYITTKKLINGKWRVWNKTIKESSQ